MFLYLKIHGLHGMNMSFFHRLKGIKKEIKEHDAILKTRAQKREKQRAEKPYQTKRLAKTKYPSTQICSL